MRAIFYHGVADPRERDHYYASNFADRTRFEADMTELARRWHPMSLAEIDDAGRQGTPLDPRAAHVSFDDGFASTLIAAEILDRLRVPWTLFVIVDATLDDYRPWFLRVANTLGPTSNVQRPDGSIAQLDTPAAKRRFATEIKGQLMAAPASRHEEVVDTMLGLPGMQRDTERWSLLGLDDVLELHHAGVEIGNHSARHRNLNRCTHQELIDEVDVSRARLEAALGSPVRYFAYPDGRFNRRVARAVGREHRLASSVWRPGTRTRPLSLPRVAGGLEPLEQAVARPTDVRRSLDWFRWESPVRAREAGHRVLQRTRPKGR